ncbi:3-phosphoshikimate 1-carboxyvinyltransferase [Ferruginibacter sp.]
MTKAEYSFSEKKVSYYFDAAFSYLEELAVKENTVLITDENIRALHSQKFEGWRTIVIKAGEEHKQQSTVDFIISELIALEADRKTFIVGVGGGVVTDITGYAASVYMRGLKFAFVPTTILAMVDASIGGKNGVDAGIYKNLVGLIKQPEFLLFDYSLLRTLPNEQWVNGFAEIVKHACIKDALLFAKLERYSLHDFKTDESLLAELIEQNVSIKTNVVVNDEFEQGDRKQLNFGHTIGHAIENLHHLLHGHAISIGMVAACNLSEKLSGFHFEEAIRIVKLLAKYHLPVDIETEYEKVFEVLKMDKKRSSNQMNFILARKNWQSRDKTGGAGNPTQVFKRNFIVKVSIKPSDIKGALIAPTSKSSMQRACAAALLHEGVTTIHNPGKSNDDLAALGIIQRLGATVSNIENSEIDIQSTGVQPVSGSISCGESGLSIRMFTPIAALSGQSLTINGTGSLLKRPMNFFDEILPLLDIKVASNAGMLPLQIKGPLQPKDITIDGSLSSQFLTGLLFAFAKAATNPVTISVNDLKSKPYIDLTLQVMQHFGYAIQNNNYNSFTIQPGNNLSGKTISYTVEGDWSGGAFLLVAGAIGGKIVVKGLDPFSTQADKAVLQAIIASGATISVEEKQIEIAPPSIGLSALKPFHFNATDCPDLFPPLVALAAYCNGTSVIEGVSRLAHKESNRGLTLQEEFAKMGVEIILQDDLMMIKGGEGLKGATVHSRHDHRIAMACAVAALKAEGETIIEEAEAINKSYPDFYEHLQLLNAAVSLIN